MSGAAGHPPAVFGVPGAGYTRRVSDETTGPTTTHETPAAGGDDQLRGSRTSATWVSVVGFGILLVLLITFIAQNTQKTEVRFLGWEGSAPQAVSLLIAATTGLALAVVAASLRILQLRRRVRRTR